MRGHEEQILACSHRFVVDHFSSVCQQLQEAGWSLEVNYLKNRDATIRIE